MMLLDDRGRLFGKISLIDLAAIGFLLSLAPVILFAWKSRGYQQLSIYDIRPRKVVMGHDTMLRIVGASINPDCKIQFNDFVIPRGTWVNETYFDADLPRDLQPGRYTVFVRNPKGRTAKLENALDVIWKPKIISLELFQKEPADLLTLVILGEHLQRGGEVTLNDIALENVRYVSDSRIEMDLQSYQIPRGRAQVRVTNPDGLLQSEFDGVLPKAKTPASTVGDAILQTDLPRPLQDGSFAVVFHCFFPESASAAGKRLKAGNVDVDSKGLVHARILKILGRIPVKDPTLHAQDRWLVVTLLVRGRAQQAGKNLLFFYRMDPIVSGAEIHPDFLQGKPALAMSHARPATAQEAALLEP